MTTVQHSRTRRKLSTIILAAGIGKRMYSKTPKVLYEILGKPILSFVIDVAKEIKSNEIIIVVGKTAFEINKAIGHEVKYAIQPIPKGTGDAAKKGIDISAHGNVLILCGDVPLLKKETLTELLNHHQKMKADLTLLTCQVKNPFGYGRIVRDRRNNILTIVEQADATIEQQKIKEINAGVYYGRKKLILSALKKIDTKNRQGEFYLTDVIKEMLKKKKKVVGLKIDAEEEITGINSKMDLSRVREVVKKKWFEQLMAEGVFIEDPTTTNIDLSVRIGKFVHIRPHTLIEGKTRIKDGLTIGPFAWIKDGKRQKHKKDIE